MLKDMKEVRDEKVIKKILKEAKEEIEKKLDIIKSCVNNIEKKEFISIDVRTLFETISILSQDAVLKIEDASSIRTVSEIDGKDLLKVMVRKKEEKKEDLFYK